MTDKKRRGRPPLDRNIEPEQAAPVAMSEPEQQDARPAETVALGVQYTNARKGRLGVGGLVFEAGQTLTLTDDDLQHPAVARAIQTGMIRAT